MSLRDAPLLYVFEDIEIGGLADHRSALEDVVGLPVVEVEPHLPHERHGVVKYDAGPLLLSLNLSTPGRFRDDASDAVVTVFDVAPGWDGREALRRRWSATQASFGEVLTDPYGHHFAFREVDAADAPATPRAAELRLAVDDVEASAAFYGELAGWEATVHGDGTARVRTPSVTLVLERATAAADGRALDRRTVVLVVHTVPIVPMREALLERGLPFSTRRVAYSEIGGTTRFDDPSGNRFCLYEPSEEALGWGSGAKVMEVASLGAATR